MIREDFANTSFVQQLCLLALISSCGQILEKDQTNYITLKSELQMVRHIDCEGKLLSERRREVAEPGAWVRVKPQVNPNDVGFSDFTVLGTQDDAGMKSDNFSIYLHLNDRLLGYQVSPGKNRIKYRFWGCNTWSDDSNHTKRICLEQGPILETGQLEIEVAFEEVDRNEIREIKPNNLVCETVRAAYSQQSSSTR